MDLSHSLLSGPARTISNGLAVFWSQPHTIRTREREIPPEKQTATSPPATRGRSW